MMANDRVGCCTAAGVYHSIQQRYALVMGSILNIPDQWVLDLYAATSNYPQEDNGTTCVRVLDYWVQHGIYLGPTAQTRDVCGGVEINPQLLDCVDDAMFWTSNLYVGVDLPLSAQGQLERGEVWDAVDGPEGEPGTWGGHCMMVGAKDQNGLRYAVTWGTIQPMTKAFWLKYIVEAYATISRGSFFLTDGKTPSGLNWDQLQADLKLVSVAQ